MVCRVVECEPAHVQLAFRLRISGVSLIETCREVKRQCEVTITRERVRLIESKLKARIEDAMRLPQ
jgi:hypothetical protein